MPVLDVCPFRHWRQSFRAPRGYQTDQTRRLPLKLPLRDDIRGKIRVNTGNGIFMGGFSAARRRFTVRQ